jgi:hypothetical protein
MEISILPGTTKNILPLKVIFRCYPLPINDEMAMAKSDVLRALF